jgi:hypothetical protein
MQRSKWIRVRPLQVSDFRFVRRLASKQPNFTSPPHYVLWLLKETNPRSCLVVEHARLGPIAYLLSLPVNNPHIKTLYVWQLAASASGQRTGAIHLLLLALRSLVRRMRVKLIVFSAIPNSLDFRVIRRYAYTLFGEAPRSRQRLPSTVSRNEFEFVIKVR